MVYTEEDLNKRLDTDIDVLLGSLTHIVESATLRQPSLTDASLLEPKDRYKIAQERQLMQGAAANIVNSAQSLLTLTSELKQALLLNDFKMLNSTAQSRWLTIKDREAKGNGTLLEFQKELEMVTADIEDALYGR
ncbi:surfeit locus protein 5 subunit 22 of mediator complex-domain-containing protein [Powellomyces hirtus]|nr:surfeit locus protein 5 subunit 22 of mediator complex-domain-containing protein [Powellomyces hirtus]